jgi:hypothetical protein
MHTKSSLTFFTVYQSWPRMMPNSIYWPRLASQRLTDFPLSVCHFVSQIQPVDKLVLAFRPPPRSFNPVQAVLGFAWRISKDKLSLFCPESFSTFGLRISFVIRH